MPASREYASTGLTCSRAIRSDPTFVVHRDERISDRSPTHPIAEVKHPVALDHHVRFLQQVLCLDRPEVALAGPEHDGYDVHAHLVDQARGKHLATDVAGGDLDHA